MKFMTKTEKDYWDQAKELLGNFKVTYDANWKFDFINDPKGLIFHLSKCKFAMRMASRDRNILELGCEIGVGASVIGEMSKSYLGVDQDRKFIEIAQKNLPGPKYKFLCDNFLGKRYGTFDSIVSFDVLDSIKPNQIDLFLDAAVDQLTEEGILILGLSDSSLIQDKLEKYFFQSWDFGMNGEIVCTDSIAPYHIFLCCHKK